MALVQTWLQENPAKLKEYIGTEEWEQFQPAYALSPELSARLWNSIPKVSPGPTRRLSYFGWAAVAASLLLVIGLSWHYLPKKQKSEPVDGATAAKTKNIFNPTAQKMALTLSDGSTVELSPNSTLSYPENFTPLKREVAVSGEATFNIARDAARPFSVTSPSILITVLGTRFTVNSNEANDAAKVILQEGRVMIKFSKSTPEDDKNEYYLAPGDIFLFKKTAQPARINPAARPATTQIPARDSLSARILHLEKDKEDRYVFNNYPLDVVFDQLQVIYNVKILYSKAELGNRSFIGKIDQKDSIEHILKSIALLNGFGFHREGDGFVINK